MNRNHIVLGLVAIILGIIVVVSCNLAVVPGEIVSGPSRLAAQLPAVNETYPVYRTVQQNVTESDVREIARLFNISGEVKENFPSAGIYRVDDCSKGFCEYVEVSGSSGAIRYQVPDKAMPYTTDRQPVLPSDDEAVAIATRYLQERGLLSGISLLVSGVSPGSAFEEYTNGVTRHYVLTKNVHVSQGIGGTPVSGSGTTVSIGENGQVVAVSTALGPIDPEPTGYVKVISPEEAYRRFLAGDLIMRPSCCYDECVVRDIALVYYNEDVIAPAYAFRCDDMTLYVRAVDPSGPGGGDREK